MIDSLADNFGACGAHRIGLVPYSDLNNEDRSAHG
jgi:hypothetical protein